MATKNPSIGKSKGLKPVIAIPRALSTYSLFSFWHSFFDKMGMEVRLSRPTDNVCIQSGNEYAGAELCLPVKSAYGHVMDLLKNNKTDAMFIPHMIADYRVPGLTQTRYCPYVEAMPSLIKSALKNRELDIRSIVSPVINFRLSHQKNAEALVEAFRPIISLTTKEVKRALIHAHKRRKVFENRLKEMGQVSMEKIKKSNKPGIVIIGRPYNTLDKGINQDIPYYIADCGVEVIPMDCLPLDYAPLTGDFKNLFWAYGQRIISSLVQVARTRGLYAVYLSNFSCGPDSFLLTYAESIMGTKPFLVLELDEHGSSGGYQTRLEAFMDVVLSDWKNNGDLTEKWDPPKESFNIEHLKDRTLWLPPMHPVGNRLFAAAIRREGFDAQPLSIEDDSSFALGKQWTRGSECLPAALTLGSFLKHLEMKGKNGIAPDEDCALFMPTSDGPCRLGQYRTLDRMVLDRLGHKKIPILSPTGENAYADFSSQLHKRLFKSMVASDILFKMRCRIRPYEVHRGDTAEVLEKWISKCEITIEKGDMNWEFFLESAMNDFLRIPVEERPCPLVGVVGEIYVRCNAYANSQVIETIEDLGGEAWLAPVSEWILYTSWIERYRSRCNGRGLWNSFKLYAKWNYMSRTEHQLYKPVKKLLHNRMEPSMEDILHEADHLLPVAFEGESILTLGRAILFGKRGADLVVNCAPFGCMHGNITTSIFEQMRETIGIPVVNTFYDGGTDNSLLGAFIHEAGQRKKDR